MDMKTPFYKGQHFNEILIGSVEFLHVSCDMTVYYTFLQQPTEFLTRLSPGKTSEASRVGRTSCKGC